MTFGARHRLSVIPRQRKDLLKASSARRATLLLLGSTDDLDKEQRAFVEQQCRPCPTLLPLLSQTVVCRHTVSNDSRRNAGQLAILRPHRVWVADRPRAVLPDGNAISTRLSGVVRRELQGPRLHLSTHFGEQR